MNVAFGGSIYQDIYAQNYGSLLKHSQSIPREYPSHSVTLAPGINRLRAIFGDAERIYVNSFHHQAVREPAPGFRVSGRAADGIIEAVESAEHKSMLAGSTRLWKIRRRPSLAYNGIRRRWPRMATHG